MITQSYLSSKSILAAIGIVFVVCNRSLGIWLNYFAGRNFGATNLLVILGVFLIIDWRNLKNLKFPVWNKYLALMLTYLILCVFYYFLSDFDQPRFMYFQLAAVCFCIALATRDNVDEQVLVRIFFLFSFITTILGLYVYLTGQVVIAVEAHYADKNVVLEQFTVGFCGVLCFYSSLLILLDKSSLLKKMGVIALPLALFLVALSTKRSNFVCCIVAFLIYVHNKIRIRQILTTKFILTVFICSMACLIFVQITGFGENAISAIFDNLVRGFSDMWSGKQTDDTGSASARAEFMKIGLRAIDHMTLDEFILGLGYMYGYLDVPILQSFCDMGLLGFSFFFYLHICKPLLLTLKLKNPSLLVMFGMYLASTYVMCLSTRTPYEYALDPILLYWALAYKRLQYNKGLVTQAY